MTFEEIRQIPDLQIEVTPAVEDAFYFLQSMQKGVPDPSEEETLEEYEARIDALVNPGLNAGKRLRQLPKTEMDNALRNAFRMLDNLKKYGVPCAAWI